MNNYPSPCVIRSNKSWNPDDSNWKGRKSLKGTKCAFPESIYGARHSRDTKGHVLGAAKALHLTSASLVFESAGIDLFIDYCFVWFLLDIHIYSFYHCCGHGCQATASCICMVPVLFPKDCMEIITIRISGQKLVCKLQIILCLQTQKWDLMFLTGPSLQE